MLQKQEKGIRARITAVFKQRSDLSKETQEWISRQAKAEKDREKLIEMFDQLQALMSNPAFEFAVVSTGRKDIFDFLQANILDAMRHEVG